MIVIESASERYYDDNGLLVGLRGENKHGKIGVFFDTENGLCPHEQVAVYCDDCKLIKTLAGPDD